MWRSQLAGYGWEGLHETIALSREWEGKRRGIRLRRRSGQFMSEAVDILWVFDISPDPEVRKGISSFQAHDPLLSQRKINFGCNMSEDIMEHIIAPLVSSFPATANVFIILDNERAVSAIHALLSAFYAPYQKGANIDSAYLGLAQVVRKLAQAPDAEDHYPYLKAALDVLISAVEQGATSPALLQSLAGLTSDTTAEDVTMIKLLAHVTNTLSNYPIVGDTAPDNND